jgi:hypothetical protein
MKGTHSHSKMLHGTHGTGRFANMELEAASFLDPSSELRWLATAGIQALQVGTLQQNLMNI